VINRIVLEGNKRIKEDKIREIKLAPRQIFTRTAVRADVARIIELYRARAASPRRSSRRWCSSTRTASISCSRSRRPEVQGPRINIIGNKVSPTASCAARWRPRRRACCTSSRSNTSYDPDRLAYDQQKLRQFYLTEGYADFRVVSAVAELTPDKRDFIITYVVEEGDRYKFGE
jgi:outer membrane protein insertion porin family